MEELRFCGGMLWLFKYDCALIVWKAARARGLIYSQGTFVYFTVSVASSHTDLSNGIFLLRCSALLRLFPRHLGPLPLDDWWL